MAKNRSGTRTRALGHHRIAADSKRRYINYHQAAQMQRRGAGAKSAARKSDLTSTQFFLVIQPLTAGLRPKKRPNAAFTVMSCAAYVWRFVPNRANIEFTAPAVHFKVQEVRQVGGKIQIGDLRNHPHRAGHAGSESGRLLQRMRQLRHLLSHQRSAL